MIKLKWKNEYCTHINDFVHVECFEGEEWKDIYYEDLITGELLDYRGFYQVSNLGRIRSLDRVDKLGRKYKGKTLKNILNHRTGYFSVMLCKDRETRRLDVHRLVSYHYVKNINKKIIVNHIDTNRQNNNSNNLEWVSYKENVNHQISKQKYINSRIGKSQNSFKMIKVVMFNGEILFFNSVSKCGEYFNLSTSKICALCSGKSKVSHKQSSLFGIVKSIEYFDKNFITINDFESEEINND